MYAKDASRISNWAHERPENFARLCQFVVLTIRQPFGRVREHMKDVNRHGLESEHLWGFKSRAYSDIWDNAEELFGDCFDADTVGFIDTLACRVHGLGIVKAAFVAQMFGHEVACMDARNIDDLGWNPRAFRTDGKFDKLRVDTRERKIAEYIQLCHSTGGAEHWWNHWCTGIAPGLGTTPERVSAWHWEIVTGAR